MIPIVLVVFFVLLFSGMSIYLALGSAAFLGWYSHGKPMIAFAQFFVDHLNTFTFVAVPMFVIAATFMERGKVSESLINLAMALLGRLNGALAYVCVAATTLFAAISGSSVATALAMGKTLVPLMRGRGYPEEMTIGTIGAAATLGILIPPSLPMIIYALVVEESVPRLFLAGVIPGLLQASLFAVYIYLRARNGGLPRGILGDQKKLTETSLQALPALSLPVVLFGGIYSGILTITEAASAAAALAILLSWLVYRSVQTKEVPWLLSSAFVETTKIIIIILCALALAHWLISQGVAHEVAGYFTESGLEAWQVLLLANLVMFILGMFLEVISVILIFVPLIIVTLDQVGIDKVHFGIVLTMNMELALLTPPIGLNLFVLSGISGTPLPVVIKGCIPFILIMVFLLGVITFVPEISLWLPNLVYGD